jgi:uncharacterized membrane protein
MRVTLALAGVEAALAIFWIASFALGGAIGSPHQQWYVEFPTLFLVLPAGSAIIAVRTGNVPDDRRFGVQVVLIGLLVCNLLAFGFYGLMSGGGV